MPLVSVIMPVYQKQRYVRQSIESIQNQTHSDFELILIDDGSTDGSGEICDGYAQKDTRIHVVHIENGGVSNARNIGLDRAKGNYVTFMDADDTVGCDYLKHMFQYAESYQVDMVIGNYEKVWAASEKKESVLLPYDGMYAFEDLLPDFAEVQFNSGIYGYCWAKLISAKLLDGVRFDTKYRLAEDLDFYLSLYPSIKTVYFHNDSDYQYLQQAENSSMICEDDQLDYFSQLVILKKMIAFLTGKHHFSHQNELLLQRRLSDYIFFSIFHCRPEEIIDMCKKIEQEKIDHAIDLSRSSLLQKYVVSMYRWRRRGLLRFMMQTYRWVRMKVRQ